MHMKISQEKLSIEVLLLHPTCRVYSQSSFCNFTSSEAKSSRKEEEEANINIDGQMYGAGIADYRSSVF
ncbi:hypothetical protein NQ318_017085 [Aromia moschata]|uniref:Uncharacterized protein n=1 Tax=Aromia moschata TaxID=1265417 RepID=A0AAV8XKQ1_9CUCU|nr:hypothetical protein NQ318_017085 [Aromia moschata]